MAHDLPHAIPLTVLGEQPCPYLPGKTSRLRAFAAHHVPPELYHELMNLGFRRSGSMIYQPICHACNACVPLRVPVQQFAPSKSQRRCWRRNQDLHVTVDLPQPTAEKFDLYRRYMLHKHSSTSESVENFVDFLYSSPVDSREFCYRDAAGTLVGVGVCDVSPQSLSSVYFYSDPVHAKRSLGTYGALYEIQWAQQQQIPYYYLGYWIHGCRKMEYKTLFRPHEVLALSGAWTAS